MRHVLWLLPFPLPKELRNFCISACAKGCFLYVHEVFRTLVNVGKDHVLRQITHLRRLRDRLWLYLGRRLGLHVRQIQLRVPRLFERILTFFMGLELGFAFELEPGTETFAFFVACFVSITSISELMSKSCGG